ncbi:zinc-binding alcohol dehydrogenase [Agromyces mediolanus]|uniref:zinc-dependent alcohol dehydrogenase n=1 Tax=Agromyces mediolanus TaxID=41986 RepID=UPI00203B9AE7|nr:zinc-binding alcohol dehydrogenase [Agromyces mediolanus]MCM3657614.1 zinc-binding alcohol dehydrogenase [Agromyces mediolanus]
MLARQLVSRAVRQMDLEPVDLPEEPAPGGIIATAGVTLISPGTEVANYLGRTTQRTPETTEPYVPGYSFAGVVTAAHPDAPFRVGERIAGPLPHASAADEARPERLARMTRIPDGVSDTEAAFTQLAAIALNAVRAGELQLGQRVVVVGAGLVGLLAAQLARLNGAHPVVTLDLMPERRARAVQLGFASFDTSDPADEAALHSLAPDGFDVVIEATGSPMAFVPALRLAARGGRVVLLGSTRGAVPDFSPYDDIHLKGLTVVGAHVSTSPRQATARDKWTEAENRRVLLELIAEGRLDVASLVTDTVGPHQASAAFDDLADRPAEHLGIAIDWSRP